MKISGQPVRPGESFVLRLIGGSHRLQLRDKRIFEQHCLWLLEKAGSTSRGNGLLVFICRKSAGVRGKVWQRRIDLHQSSRLENASQLPTTLFRAGGSQHETQKPLLQPLIGNSWRPPSLFFCNPLVCYVGRLSDESALSPIVWPLSQLYFSLLSSRHSFVCLWKQFTSYRRNCSRGHRRR